VARHPAAVADDCSNADVLVIDMPRPADCLVPATVVDVFDRWQNGAYALYLERDEANPEPHVRVETVAAHRGERPWSVTPVPKTFPISAGEASPEGVLAKPRVLDAPGQSPDRDGIGPAVPNASSPIAGDSADLAPSTVEEDPGEIAEPGGERAAE